MKIITDQITLNGKTYEATEIDYDSYEYKEDSIILKDKTYSAVQVIGKEGDVPPEITGCIYFESEEPFTVKLVSYPYYRFDGTLEYSTDNQTWNSMTGSEIQSVDNKVYFRGIGNTYCYPRGGNNPFFILKGSNIKCNGNMENLLDYETVLRGEHPPMADQCFRLFFQNSVNLIKAPELKAMSLSNRCYENMFTNCTELTKTPELPAINLSSYCYSYMFSGCTNLTQISPISAINSANNCCEFMFYNCSNLTKLPKLLPTDLKNYCYYLMFYYCSNIKLSEIQDDEYKYEYRIPFEGEGIDEGNALNSMFNVTGGTFTGTPEINKTYYTTEESI